MENESQTQASGAQKLSQIDAVYTFTIEALTGLTPDQGGKPNKEEGQKLKDLVTKEVRKVVRQKLFAALRSGQVKLSKPYSDSRLKKYCSGLINNWLKKDPRFN